MFVLPNKKVKIYGMFGSESLGKTTAGYMITGILRTWGFLSEFVTDSSGAMPFPPSEFDTNPYAWIYVWTKKIMRECEYAIRTNVDVIITDRTPLDLYFYYKYKAGHSIKVPTPLLDKLFELAKEWAKQYDILFWLPAEGTTFRYDKFREPNDTSRNAVEKIVIDFINKHKDEFPNIVPAPGTYRERSEFMYHRILQDLGVPDKTVETLKKVSNYAKGIFGNAVKEVYLEGSNSVQRFHIPKENDDFDIVIVLNNYSTEELLKAQEIVEKDKNWLEKTCEGDLDIKVVNDDYKPFEI